MVIPEVLRPYMQGRDFLPWLKYVPSQFPRFITESMLIAFLIQAAAEELDQPAREEADEVDSGLHAIRLLWYNNERI